jgi:tetratricopeptide (TPR) repeat protein
MVRGAPVLLLIAAAASADSVSDALRTHRYGDALAQADVLLKATPGDARLWTARGLALQGLSREKESLASFETALRSSPDFAPALKGAVEVAYRTRDPRAGELLERLLRIEPKNSTAHAMAGVLAFEHNECQSAVRHFEASLHDVRANPQASAMYGECLVKLDRAADAVPVLESVAANNPDTAALRSLACAQLAAHQDDAALATTKRVIDSAPGNEQNYVDVASDFLSRNFDRAAEFVIDAGLKRLPGSARLYGLRGVIEAQRGLDDAAARDFEKSNELDPKRQYGSAGLGVLYTGTERSPEAAAILRQRLAKDPSDAELNYLLAQALTRQDATPGTSAFQEAQEALLRALRVKPDYAAAHAALGKLYAQAGKNARAIGEFQSAVDLNPADRTALSQLAAALRRAGRTDEALAVSRRLKELVTRESRPSQ